MHPDNKMPRRTLKGYEYHSKHKEYKERIKEAENNVKTILESNYKPHIEFSGGKDSLVLLHLFMKQDNTIPVYNYHPGYGKYSKQLYRSLTLHNELIKSAQITGCKDLTVVNTPFCRPDYLIGDYFKLLTDFMKYKKTDCRVVGIRADESSGRRNRCKGNMIRKENGKNVALPIRYLTVDDIWAYIVTNDLYYLSNYDLYAPVHGWDKVRFTSLFNDNLLNDGGSYYFDKLLRSHEHNTELTSSNAKDWIVDLIDGEPVYFKGGDCHGFQR